MRQPVLCDRVPFRRGDPQDLDSARLVLLHAVAIEQHDRIFHLAGDDAAVGGALEPVRQFRDVLRDAFALAHHHAVGIGPVVVAGVRRLQEILRRLGEIGFSTIACVKRHDAEVIEGSGMFLGCRALELFLGARHILWHAVGPLEQQPAELVGRLRIAEIARQTIPARRLEVVSTDCGAVVVDRADQRHRGGVPRVVVDAALRLLQREQEVAR